MWFFKFLNVALGVVMGIFSLFAAFGTVYQAIYAGARLGVWGLVGIRVVAIHGLLIVATFGAWAGWHFWIAFRANKHWGVSSDFRVSAMLLPAISSGLVGILLLFTILVG